MLFAISMFLFQDGGLADNFGGRVRAHNGNIIVEHEVTHLGRDCNPFSVNGAVVFTRQIDDKPAVGCVGDIYLVRNNGEEVRLTNGHRDYSPSLSKDGARVLFCRSTGRKHSHIGTANGTNDESITEIWSVLSAGDRPAAPVFSGPFHYDGDAYTSFHSPRYSASGDMIYFLFDLYAVTGGLAALEVSTGKTHFITTAIDYLEVASGGQIGSLIVQQRRLYAGAGTYYWFWLVGNQGGEPLLVGPDLAAVRAFLEQ